MKKKKNLVMIISMIVLTLIIIAGSSYAFFELTINNDDAARADVTAKNLKLEFTDGPKVELTDVLPGATIIKTFSVENTGTETLYYSIYLNDVINSFTRTSDLVYTLTSTNAGGIISETVLPQASGVLAGNIAIPKDVTQNYTLTITYKNLNEDQNADMGKMFSGTIQLVAGVKAYNLTGYAYDNNGDLMNSGTVEVHSDVITAPIQRDGSFTLLNVPVGDHEIIIKNANQVVVAEDTFKLEESNNTSISGNSIKVSSDDKTMTIALNTQSAGGLIINSLGNLNTVDLIINNASFVESTVLTAYDGQKTSRVRIIPEIGYHFKNVTCDNDIELDNMDLDDFYVKKLTTSGTCTINYEIDRHTIKLNVINGNGSTVREEDYSSISKIYLDVSPNSGYQYDDLSCTSGYARYVENNGSIQVEITPYTDVECTLTFKHNICIPAATLHTEICNSDNCVADGISRGSTISYGNLITASSCNLNLGDAFDCDVNGDGTYDAVTERFYLLTDNNTAILIYYNNVSAGVPNNTSAFAYDSSSSLSFGPRTAVLQLPSTSQWSNVRLSNTISNIGALPQPISFSYAGYATRLLSMLDDYYINGCFNSLKLLPSCSFMHENTSYSNSSLISGFWLADSSVINPFSIDYSGISDSYSANNSTSLGVRPVIEVPKTEISCYNR